MVSDICMMIHKVFVDGQLTYPQQQAARHHEDQAVQVQRKQHGDPRQAQAVLPLQLADEGRS